MERLAAAAAAAATAASLPEKTTTSSSGGFVNWDEVFVSTDRGKREVHYFLNRSDGSSDLAVIGKEKSLRHMSYHYAFQNRFLNSVGLFTSLTKLKSRREVVDWLNSIVSDSRQKSPQTSDCLMDREDADACQSNFETLKGFEKITLGQHTREFSWLGDPWMCRRRRRHYPSFSRNGVKISVHDFVYVLAEEGKRLVAYLEDMYEDSRSNKMVVVRWFHRIDEVDIVLPHNFNDREIFFSLCLQDLNIECIDGLATVLSPHHFQKFQNDAKHTLLEPFLCEKQFDNGDVNPFDITQIKGYWKQEILRYMYALSASKTHSNSQQSEDDVNAEDNINSNGTRPRKRHRRSRNDDAHNTDKRHLANASCQDNNLVDFKNRCDDLSQQKGSCASKMLPGKELKNISLSPLTVGSEIEVLSQDSGIRGCWFRASIIKRHKDKVKVQYHDLKDVDDESKKLVEWLLASRVADTDQLGLRVSGRSVIRPLPQPSKNPKVSRGYNVGSVVDVWRFDGWWEGIVVEKEFEDKLRVHFPGEKQESVFSPTDMRHSQEWSGSGWIQIQERPDIASSILALINNEDLKNKPCVGKSTQVVDCDMKQSAKDRVQPIGPSSSSDVHKVKKPNTVPDLANDDSLAKLRWKSSKKRSHCNIGSLQKHLLDNYGTCERLMITPAMKVDHDNCKYLGDSMFTSSVVPHLSNLVMSR